MAVAGVLFPIPLNLESRNTRGAFQSGGDFKTGCASITIIPISVAVISLPVAFPLAAGYFLELPLAGLCRAAAEQRLRPVDLPCRLQARWRSTARARTGIYSQDEIAGRSIIVFQRQKTNYLLTFFVSIILIQQSVAGTS